MRPFAIFSITCASLWLLAACGGAAPATPTFKAVPAPAPADLPVPYNAADLVRGKDAFSRKCGACHFIARDRGNNVGPNLHDVFERGMATAASYKYSPALTAFCKTRPDWTPDLLDQWLMSPDSFAPGTAMRLSGITDPAERRDLIAYLLIATRQ